MRRVLLVEEDVDVRPAYGVPVEPEPVTARCRRGQVELPLAAGAGRGLHGVVRLHRLDGRPQTPLLRRRDYDVDVVVPGDAIVEAVRAKQSAAHHEVGDVSGVEQ